MSPSTDTVCTAIFSDGKTPLQTGSVLLLLGRPPLLLIQATPSLPPFPLMRRCCTLWMLVQNEVDSTRERVVATSLHSASTEQIIMDNCCSCHLPLMLNFEVRNCKWLHERPPHLRICLSYQTEWWGGQSGGRAGTLIVRWITQLERRETGFARLNLENLISPFSHRNTGGARLDCANWCVTISLWLQYH